MITINPYNAMTVGMEHESEAIIAEHFSTLLSNRTRIFFQSLKLWKVQPLQSHFPC